MKKFLLPLLIWMATAAHAVDTLDVFVLRVQFKKESPDNSLTTGNGLFGSDTATYSLDPSESRGSRHYWRKHLDFANAYYQAASGGELFIKSTVFPKNGTAYELDKPMIDYNRTEKMKGEKTAQYDEARSRDYLRFVYDAVMAAHKSGKDSPFSVPLPQSSNTKRVFMIAHAGASRLLDGGSMGTKGANTPGDFMDIYISKRDWVYLSDSVPEVVIAEDSLDNGLVLKDAAIDTLKSIMVVSETASQDGLNWGINGIVVNQIGRELGMPDTYDAVKGISRLGYFDVMDFAGYFAGNGFFPVLPAAWERAYMGWSKVKEVRPTAGHPVTVDIAAAGSGLGTEIVKVALNANEYFLIENRQRSIDDSVTVYLGKAKDNDNKDIKKYHVDSLHVVFEDSVCTNGKCKKNSNKAEGLVVGTSAFDACLPASGIVVWRVNDWFLRESLPLGMGNLWLGNELRDHQFGLSLVESDGVLSIGKTFKNAIGEDTYDFGSGADMLPHLRYAKSKKFDTVKSILPTGYANTATTMGGYTGIKISVEVPKNARIEKTLNAFMGDSVVNFAAPVIRVTISVDDGSIENSKFPRNIGLASAVRGAVFVENPENEDEKIMVIGAEDGTLQAFTALGDTLFMADTSITQQALDRRESENKVPLYRTGASFGPLVGMASDGKDVYSLHRDKLVKTSFDGGVPMLHEVDVKSATVGPVIHDGKIKVADRNGVNTYSIAKFGKEDAVQRESLKNIVDMAYCGNDDYVYVTGDGVLYLNGASEKLKTVAGKPSETWRVACTDLDRDGKQEAIAVGSRGTVAAKSLDGRQDWTRSYMRGATGSSCVSDSSCLKDETSGIALGDVNGDGYPEIVFLGDNLVYALDRFGVPIDGFPVKISRGTPVAAFHSDPLIVDVTGDNLPEILVPSNGGLVYAYTGKGKRVSERFPIAAGSYEMTDSLQMTVPMSIFVADAIKGAKGPELYAIHRNSVSAFSLSKASEGAETAAAAWALPAGGDDRSGYLDASRLGDAEDAKAKDEITEFFIFPNPVRGGQAKARLGLGAKPKSVKLELYDITGLCVFKTDIPDGVAGANQVDLDLRNLGSDIYTARLKVKFQSGKTKQKLYRVGVVR